eukprot:576414-Rhodomonas_salina.1
MACTSWTQRTSQGPRMNSPKRVRRFAGSLPRPLTLIERQRNDWDVGRGACNVAAITSRRGRGPHCGGGQPLAYEGPVKPRM